MNIFDKLENITLQFKGEVENSSEDFILHIKKIIKENNDKYDEKIEELNGLLIEYSDEIDSILEEITEEIERREREKVKLIDDWFDFKRTILEPLQKINISLKEKIE